MPQKPVDAQRFQAYLLYRHEGMSKRAACAKAGISYSTIMRIDRDPSYSPEYRKAKKVFDELHPKDAVPDDQLDDPAKRALADFAYFRLRFTGRYSTPWQVHAAEVIREKLESDDKEYVVINVPPGAGKSTLFTHDIPCWLIARNRAVRIMIGSATERVARSYGARIRRTLERTEPVKNDSALVERGLIADAESTMVNDFGRFKPTNRDLWRSEEFVVEQADGTATDEKEATVATYGRDGGFLGGRFDYVIWDDLVTKKVLRTAESRENLIEWWNGEAETRVEPGGCMVLQGQRLHADDLYRYALDKRAVPDEDDDAPDDDLRLYKHIIYKAHYPEHCRGLHTRDAPAYDPKNPTTSGCLLDPRRLSWRELRNKQADDMENFLVVYQQEDVDPAAVLVDQLWIAGGRDPETGTVYPGCWDHDRSVWQIPKGLSKPYVALVTADPSPSKFWSVQFWLIHVATEQWFLIDLERRAMRAEDFLDYDINQGKHVGMLEDWWQQANKKGVPFKHVIVEDNAAQRFLLQYDHVRKWMALRSVLIIGHQTHGENKTNPEFGVQTIAADYKFGRVRLPGNKFDGSRGKSMALVSEVTRWPESRTDDCVMAHWFGKYRWQRHLRAQATRPAEPPRFARPSWLRRTG